MIIGIEGFMGDGKTVFMVRSILIDYLNSRPIYANFKLKEIEYKPLLIEDFLNTDTAEKYKNATLCIDEITLFMDCRRSSKKENIALSTLLRQSRKRNICIIFTCQNFEETDIRLINFTSIFVIAERVYRINENDEKVEVENLRQYTIIDTRQREENVTKLVLDITPFFKYYDTDEIIESIYETKKTVKGKQK